MILTDQPGISRKELIKLQHDLCCLNTNFCPKVFTCLGVNPSGSSSLFLNQQGHFVSASGGGGTNGVLNTTTVNGQALSSNVTITSSTLGITSGSFSATGVALQVNFVVTHSAGFTPSQIFVTPTSLACAALFFISAKTSSTLTVTFISSPGVVPVSFDWLIKQ